MRFSIVIALLLVAAAGYLYLNPELRRDWFRDTLLEPAPGVAQLYKWQDASGIWQVTDEPPPRGTEYELLELRGDITIMPAERGD